MSDGPRFSRTQALGVVAFLRSAWSMDERHCPVVGSVRRGERDVGDVELIAPVPDQADADSLYQRIARNCPRSQTINAGLFDGGLDARRPEQVWCEPLAGVKERFLEARMRVTLWEIDTKREYTVPVQIFRYTRINRGWVELMRTGPAGFGKALLARWRRVHGLGDQPCSKDGCLQLPGGPAQTYSETDVFRMADLPFIEPHHRGMIADRIDRDEGYRRSWISGARAMLPTEGVVA